MRCRPTPRSASPQQVGYIMIRGLFASAVAVVALVLVMDSSVEGGKDKLTIKEVMKKAHVPPAKGEPSLLAKVTSGKASSEERKELVSLYQALAKNDPPKGEQDSWKEKTEALVKAAKANDADALKKASNCAACHKEHKGKK